MGNIKKEFPRGQLNPAILSTLIERDKYGYEIIEEIKQKTGIEVKQPSLYSSLKRMENQKYISSYWQNSDIGGRRHYYCLTAVGKDFLDKNPINSSLFIEKTISPAEKEINQVDLEKIELDKEKQLSENTEIQFEKKLRNTVQKIEERVEKSLQEQSLNEENNTEKTPRFIQQDNIFNNIKVEKSKENSVQIEQNNIEKSVENFEQFELFDKPNAINSDMVKIKNLHKKSANNPYQLKQISEEELRKEYENIRNKKFGIIANINSQIDSEFNTNYEIKQPHPSQVTPTLTNASSNIESNFKRVESIFAKDNLKDFNTENKEVSFASSSPASLNIESNNYSSFLNTQQHTDKNIPIKKEIYRYNYDKSMEKLESKFKEYALNKKDSYESEVKFDKGSDNTYERVKNFAPTFNSYKSLQVYFNSLGIGASIYNKKNKERMEYVNSALIRFIRSIAFSLISIILSFAFYFGINHNSIGKIIYIIIPIISLIFPLTYGLKYYKKPKIVLQSNQTHISPIIMPMVSICVSLIIIGINLASGFKSGKTLEYFPLLIYPICLATYIAFIYPLNKLIKYSVIKFRKSNLINKNID